MGLEVQIKLWNIAIAENKKYYYSAFTLEPFLVYRVFIFYFSSFFQFVD